MSFAGCKEKILGQLLVLTQIRRILSAWVVQRFRAGKFPLYSSLNYMDSLQPVFIPFMHCKVRIFSCS
jgi:hypothetical protein